MMERIISPHLTKGVYCSHHPNNQSIKIKTNRGYLHFDGCETGIKCKHNLIHKVIPNLMDELENGYVEYNKLKNEHIEALNYINRLQNHIKQLEIKNKQLRFR